MMNKSTFDFIIERVVDNALDAAQGDDGDKEFLSGKKLAYYETLDTIKNELIAHDIDVSEYGLNTVLEKLL